jgi:hypothetical protein
MTLVGVTISPDMAPSRPPLDHRTVARVLRQLTLFLAVLSLKLAYVGAAIALKYH